MATDEQINNQREFNDAAREGKDYIRESYEFLGDTLDIGAKIADQLKSITNSLKDKTKLDKETLKRADETVKVISELGVDYTDLSKVQKDMEKIDKQRQKNMVTIAALSKNLTKDEIKQAESAVAKQKEYDLATQALSDNVEEQERITKAIEERENLGIDASALYDQLDAVEREGEERRKNVTSLGDELNLLQKGLNPRAMSVALLKEQNKGLDEALEYLEQEEQAILNIRDAMTYWNVSLGAVQGFMKGIGIESASVALGLEAGAEAAQAMAEKLTKDGQKSIGILGKTQVLLAGIGGTIKALIKNLGGALTFAAFARSLGKVLGTIFAPLKNFIGDLREQVGKAFSYLKDEFFSLSSYIADYKAGETLFFELGQAVADTATNLGVATDEAKALYNQVSSIAKETGQMPEDFLKTAETLNKTYGATKKFSDDTLKTVAQLTNLYGLSAEEASKLTQQADLAGQETSDYALEVKTSIQALKDRYDIALSEQEVMRATATAGDAFVLSVGSSGKEIAKAAFQAKRLGLEMSGLENIGNNLLDFESSISKEMEAELLLGRDLNLEKARQAALNNDLATVGKEVAKQIGSASEFTKMNVIQQKALADSIGVSKDELATMLKTQELLAGTGFDDMNSAQEKFKKLLKETGSEEAALAKMREMGASEALGDQLRQLSAQERRANQERAIAEAQAKLASAAIPMVNAFLKFTQYVKEIKAILVDQLRPFFKNFADLIRGGGKEMREGLVEPAKQLGGYLNDVGNTIVNFIRNNLDGVRAVFKGIFGVVSAIYEFIGGIIKRLLESAEEATRNESIFEKVSRYLNQIQEYIKGIDIDYVADRIEAFALALKDAFLFVVDKVKAITEFAKEHPTLFKAAAITVGAGAAAAVGAKALLGATRATPMYVKVTNTEDIGEGGGGSDGDGGILGSFIDKLKDKFMGGGEEGGPSAFDLAKEKGLSDKQILAGFGGKEAMEEMKASLTDGLQDKAADLKDNLKDRIMGGGDDDGGGGGGGGGIGSGLSSIGKGIGDFGKGVGKGIGGVFKGLASGLAAFANPAILLGATILSGSIAIIAAGIAGATYIFSKVLPTLAEGMKSLEELDGKALAQAGGGMAAIGGGLVALAAGGVAATGAALAIGAIALMGPGIFKPIEDFGRLNLDVEKISNNAAAVAAWSLGMAALAVGSAAGAVASLAGLAGGIIDGITGFFGSPLPEDKMVAFQKMNLDPKRMARNSKAVVAYSAGMAALAVGSAASGVASLANMAGNIFDGIAGFFGTGNLPGDKMIAFQNLNLDATKMENNSKAVVAYAFAMTALAGGSVGSTLSSMANAVGSAYDGLVSFFGGDLPGDKMIKFQNLNLDPEKMGNNADAVAAYTKAMAILAVGSAASTVSSLANVAGSLADGIVGFFGGDLPLDKVKKFGEIELNAKNISNNANAVVAYGEAMAALGKGDAMSFVGSLANAGKQLVDGIVNFFGGTTELPIDKLNKFGAMKINAPGIKKNADALVMFSEAMSGLKELNKNIATLGNVLSNRLIKNLNSLNNLEVKNLNLSNLVEQIPLLAKIANIVVENKDAFVGASYALKADLIETFNLLSTLVIPESKDYTPLSEAAQAVSSASTVILKADDEYNIRALTRVIDSDFVESLNSLNKIIPPAQDFSLLLPATTNLAEGITVLMIAEDEHSISRVYKVIDDDLVESINLLNGIQIQSLDFSKLPPAAVNLAKALTKITSTPAFLEIENYLTRNLPFILNRVNKINFDKVNFEAMDTMSEKLPRLVEAYGAFGKLNINAIQKATNTIAKLNKTLPKKGIVDSAIDGIKQIPGMLEDAFSIDTYVQTAAQDEGRNIEGATIKTADEVNLGADTEIASLKQELGEIKTLLKKVINRPIEVNSTIELDGNKVGQALGQNSYNLQ